jgi:hypothetical protein
VADRMRDKFPVPVEKIKELALHQFVKFPYLNSIAAGFPFCYPFRLFPYFLIFVNVPA